MARLILVLATIMAGAASAQDDAGPDIVFGGTHPPDPGVMALLQEYSIASQQIAEGVMARSEALAPLQSEGYFYHGLDGAPIGKAGLDERQVRNNLKIEQSEILNGHLYQYENTAIAAYHTRSSGEDRGRRFDDLMTSNLIVMGRVGGEWKVLSDIVGAEPPLPAE
jgi:hypothetical protein